LQFFPFSSHRIILSAACGHRLRSDGRALPNAAAGNGRRATGPRRAFRRTRGWRRRYGRPSTSGKPGEGPSHPLRGVLSQRRHALPGNKMTHRAPVAQLGKMKQTSSWAGPSGFRTKSADGAAQQVMRELNARGVRINDTDLTWTFRKEDVMPLHPERPLTQHGN
jgi:hypothetical protein